MKRFFTITFCSFLVMSSLLADQAADTLLFEGISLPSLEKVKEAFTRGASTDARDADHRTSLEIALRMYSLLKRGGEKVPEVQQELAIYQAIVQEIMIHVITVNPEDFIFAARYKSPDIIEQMLNKGIDINVKNKRGNTALMALVSSVPDLDTVKFLVAKGADINASDQRTFGGKLEEKSVLDFALRPGSPKQLDAANYLIDAGAILKPKHFFFAATSVEPNLDFVKKIHKRIKNIDAAGYGDITPLRDAVTMDYSQALINYLLDEKASVNAASSTDPESILLIAIRRHYYSPDGPVDLVIIERMLKAGAIIDDKVMALARGDFKELIKLLGEGSGHYTGYNQPDPIKKEQVLKLLEQYRNKAKSA